ncbi:hypothetical protein LJB95_00435 [Paludibacteraceae bacterium OttesenSCG-928-F17]|nr:hypothetical protein [Paludibacteraceae bacterium OttesenSCG-928-F17]
MFEPRTASYDSRKSFERSAFMLAERINAGTILFNQEMEGMSHISTGLTRVRELPNKRINLLTIDESVRSIMHMIPQMDNFKEKKHEEKE